MEHGPSETGDFQLPVRLNTKNNRLAGESSSTVHQSQSERFSGRFGEALRVSYLVEMNRSTPASPLRRSLGFIVKFTVPVAIIAWLLWSIEPEQWEELRGQQKHVGLLVAALSLALLALATSFVRWGLLVRCQGIPLSLVETLRLGAIGFLLSFVSVGSVGGDLFKAIFLARRSPGKRVEAVASVIVDRGSGLFGLLLIASLALLFAPPVAAAEDRETLRQMGRGATLLMGLGAVLTAVLVLGGRSIDRLVQGASRLRLVGPYLARGALPLRAFHTHPWGFANSVVLSVVVQSLFAASVYLIAAGLYGGKQAIPTLTEHFIIVPFGMLASSLPIAPAGLGLFEAAVEWGYRVVPAIVTKASGTMVALVFEFVKVVLAVAGVIFYWTAGREVRKSIEESETEEASGE